MHPLAATLTAVAGSVVGSWLIYLGATWVAAGIVGSEVHQAALGILAVLGVWVGFGAFYVAVVRREIG